MVVLVFIDSQFILVLYSMYALYYIVYYMSALIPLNEPPNNHIVAFRRSHFYFRLTAKIIYNTYWCVYNQDGVKQHRLHKFLLMSGSGSYLLQSLHPLRLPLETQVQPAKLQIHGRHVQRVGGVVHTGGTTAQVEDNASEDTTLKKGTYYTECVISRYKPF